MAGAVYPGSDGLCTRMYCLCRPFQRRAIPRMGRVFTLGSGDEVPASKPPLCRRLRIHNVPALPTRHRRLALHGVSPFFLFGRECLPRSFHVVDSPPSTPVPGREMASMGMAPRDCGHRCLSCAGPGAWDCVPLCGSCSRLVDSWRRAACTLSEYGSKQRAKQSLDRSGVSLPNAGVRGAD